VTRNDDTGPRTRRSRTAGRTERLTRYDPVLAVIPMAFVVSVLVGHLLAIPTRTALAAAAVVSGLAMLDALFFRPPTRPDGT
jgi:hypothetical protein